MRNERPSSQSPEKFIRALSESLHRMAQPLSIVQATLELALLEPANAKEYRGIIKEALEQLRRTFEPMQFAGQLTRFQQPAADVGDVLLSQTVEEVITSLHRTLESAQIGVLFSRPGRELPVRISPTRLRQMIFYILQAVQALSQPGDAMHVAVKAHAGRLGLSIQLSPTGAPGASTVSAGEVRAAQALALADAVATNAAGEFSVTVNPLRIVADFPTTRARIAHAGKYKVDTTPKSRPTASSQ